MISVINKHTGFVPHVSTDLTYRILDGQIPLEPMKIFGERSIQWNGWRITFYVLGASHAMKFEKGPLSFTELLTCVAPQGNSKCLIDAQMPEIVPMHTHIHNLDIEVCCRTLPMVGTQIVEIESATSSRTGTGCNVLEYAYPNPDIDQVSWTKLRWNVTADRVVLDTLHSYPHELLSVLSCTTVSRLTAGAPHEFTSSMSS